MPYIAQTALSRLEIVAIHTLKASLEIYEGGNKMKIYKYHSCENSFILLEFHANIEYDKVAKALCVKYDVDGKVIND